MAGGAPGDGAQEDAARDVRVRWPWAALAGLAAALALVALAAAAAGPPAVTGESALARWLAVSPPDPSPEPTAATTSTASGDGASDPQQSGSAGPAWIGLALAAVVVALAARVLLRRDHPDGGTRAVRLPTPGAAGVPAGGLADQVRRAADHATGRDGRGGGGSSTDEVITCWLALEAAASQAGTARDAAQTPTEFTATVLATHHADAEAVRRLLHLYHRARFGGRPLPPAAGREAAEALARIAVSLGAPTGRA